MAGTVDITSNSWRDGGDETTRAALTGYLDAVVTTPLLRAVAHRSLAALRLARGARVLDVGCGTGVFLPVLAEEVGSGGRVVGLDHAPDFVATAQARIDSLGLQEWVEVLEGDAFALPFPDDAFAGAHCERVLMHLADPVAALAEMCRVVQPGGMVVAAEPDWAGVRIDHPDRATFDALYTQWLAQLRQPAMGLEVRRRMVEAGLVDVEVELVAMGMHEAGVLAGYGLDLGEAAVALAATERLDRARAERAIAWLTEASEAGTYFAYSGVQVARGTVPAR